MSRRCTAIKNDGQPCNAWAVHGSQLALCRVHGEQGSRVWGSGEVAAIDTGGKQEEKSFYSASYSLEELSDLVHLAMDHTLDDEVGAVRIAVRRVMAQMQEELTPAEYARMASTIFSGANAIARLLKTSRDLAEEMTVVIEEASFEALDDLSKGYRAEL